MTSTKNDAITLFLTRFPDCPTTQANDLFDEIHRRIIDACEIRVRNITVPLIAGQREYTLDGANFDVLEAYYQQSSNSSTWLVITSQSRDQMAVLRTGWQFDTTIQSGPPTYFYITAAPSGNSSLTTIGFDPVPQYTTVAGYPTVMLSVNQYATLSSGDLLPDSLLGAQVYVMGMCWLWTRLSHPDQTEIYSKYFNQELQDNQAHVKSKMLQTDTYFTPYQYRRRSI